jgi:hypothetical protein
LNVKIIKEIEETMIQTAWTCRTHYPCQKIKSITNEKASKPIFPSNQRLKDEIRGKNHIKIVIKRIREKIKSKNKLEAIKKI